jgi:hypothetical protein
MRNPRAVGLGLMALCVGAGVALWLLPAPWVVKVVSDVALGIATCFVWATLPPRGTRW